MGKNDLVKKIEDFFRLTRNDSRDYARAYDIYTESQEVSERINERTSDIAKKSEYGKKLTEDHANLIWLQGFYIYASKRNPKIRKIARSVLFPDGLRGLLIEAKNLLSGYQSP